MNVTLWRFAAIAGLVTVVAAGAWIRMGPLPAGLLDFRNAESTQVVDRNGEILYEARADDGSRTSWLAPDRLPQSLVDATVAAEDHRFFSHPGIDPISLARAALRDLRHRRALEGGSTITQQVAKLLLARQRGSVRRRTVWTKLHEAVVALRLEHRLGKREVLALYLNLAPYGNQLTGAGRASRAYFGHDVSLVTPAQAAFLAALPQRPSSYNPYRDQTRARRRQEYVIVRMGLLGTLTPDRVRDAMAERLALANEPGAFVAPHFVQRVMTSPPPDGRNPAMTQPRRIQTTLDATLQREVEGVIRAERSSLERHGAHNIAVVVLDNTTGEWLAWEGSGDYADGAHGGAIDGASTPRQPGSALKPFTYALAFEDGESPATALPDVPSYFPTAQDGVLYSPRNYDGQFRGPLLARRALAGSQNVPAVALASRVGVPNLLRFLRTAGFSTFDRTAAHYGLGVTLGDAEVRLDELVAAYAAFARGGLTVQPTFVRHAGAGPRVGASLRLVSPRTAYWITDILSDDDARAYAFGRGGSLEFPFAVAAKTGTSQAYRDNWTIGYTRAVTVGVWVGNFDRRPLIGSSGVTGAGPIFHGVMLAAMRRVSGGLPAASDSATDAHPERSVRQSVCALSGLAATRYCPNTIEEWSASESLARHCSWHRPTPDGVAVDWPPEYQAWAARYVVRDRAPRDRGEGDRLAAPAPAASPLPKPKPQPRATALRVLSPPDGAVYLIDPTLRREFQTIGLRVSAGDAQRVEWRVDDVPIGTIEATAALDWPLASGRHVISAHDNRGHRADATIVVK
jgi:penicillin-binding protein 1C